MKGKGRKSFFSFSSSGDTWFHLNQCVLLIPSFVMSEKTTGCLENLEEVGNTDSSKKEQQI